MTKKTPPSPQKISRLLSELYTIDPTLASHETELRRLLSALLTARPSLRPDPEFARSLRSTLLSSSSSLLSSHKSLFSSLNPLNFMSKLTYALSGALVAALVAVPLTYHLLNSNSPASSPTTPRSTQNLASNSDSATPELAFAPPSSNITPKSPQSFGSLRTAPPSPTSSSFSPGFSGAPLGLGGSGPAIDSATAESDEETAKISLPTEPEPFPFPRPMPNTPELVYTGDPLDLTEQEVTVYRFTPPEVENLISSDLISSLGFNIVDTSALSSPTLSYLTLSEQTPYGLNYMLDTLSGRLTLSKNYTQWPNPYNNCQNPKCYESLRLTPSDLPADSKLISLADDFLSRFNIDTSSYGTPRLLNQLVYLERYGDDEARSFIPDEIQVIYPYLINNQTVQDEFGNPYGLNVTIDLHQSRAAGVFNLRFGSYEASSYTAETSADRILSFATRGGRYPIYLGPEAPETLELDTPTQTLLQYHNFTEGKPQELYVPALSFPIKNASELSLSRTHIVIPLVSEILADYEQTVPLIKEMVPLEG